MVARVIIGDLGGGSFGIRSSLPGFDVNVVGHTDDTQFLSFSSNWTSSLKVLQTGVGTVGVSNVGQVPLQYTVIPFPNQGYYPLAEVRRVSGSTVFDDDNEDDSDQLLQAMGTRLLASWVSTNALGVQGIAGDQFEQGFESVIYAIFKEPIG